MVNRVSYRQRTIIAVLCIFAIFPNLTLGADLPRVLKPGDQYENILIDDKGSNWTVI
jgi:hypothetical protein